MENKYAEADRIEQRLILRRMSDGARLYIADQPYGPDSDVYTWTASLTTEGRDRGGRQVMGRDLKAMQERHWITYNRALDEFTLTDDGRAMANEAESETRD
jgi:hypothetical protein